MRYPTLLISISLIFTALSSAAQNTAPATRPTDKDFLPAGPFYFELGATQPTYLDAFDIRPIVRSPDGKLAVTVTGPKESYGAWVTIDPSAFPDGPVQVWPIQANVDVLWRPDSQAFAVTDNRYANLSYALIFGTEFRMGENGPELGIPVEDLTPAVRMAFEERAQKHYGPNSYDTLLFYAKVLRWLGDELLLIGVSAKTQGPSTFANRGIEDSSVGYLVDVPHKTVVRELSKGQLLSEFRIKVAE